MRINVGEFLARRAMLSPNLTGLVCGSQRYTFRDLNRRSNRLAHAMIELGIHAGDRVGILAKNSVIHFDLFFGLAKIGAILVPINYRLASPELASIFRDSGIDVLVTSPEFEDRVDECGSWSFARITTGNGRGESYDDLLGRASAEEPTIQASDDDGLALLYTIWSIGRPRGVLLSHANFFWSAVSAVATIHRLGPHFLLSLPLFHIGSLGWLPFFLHRGTRCILMPQFDADDFLETVAREQVTAFGLVPTMLHHVKSSAGFAKADFSGVRGILAYGSAVPPELIKDFAAYGIAIRQLYGLTESAGAAMVIDFEHALEKAGSCGQPFFHTRVKLVDHAGGEVERGETGEIVIQANHVMKCYWNQPEATEDALRGGWLFTGDLGRQDGDGYYYVVDRKKDLIISGGENIFPAEVEKVLFEHPAVADAAVIGVKDEVWGEKVKAFVVARSGAAVPPKELMEWMKGRIAGYKIPKEIELTDLLPRTLTGKMEKKKLRPD